MAKAKPASAQSTGAAVAPKAAKAPATDTPKGFQEPKTGGTVTANPPIEGDAAVIAKAKKEASERDAAARAEKDKIKADKAAAKKVDQDAKAAERATKKAEREARIAALAADGKNYTGSMLALADRVKQGVYVVGATGQLRSNDELAQALDGVSATDVIRVGLDVLKIEDNPYTALNVGQQSMNLRNRMRGAIKKETLTIAAITDYIVRNKITVTPAVSAEEKAAAKAEKVAKAAKAKADKEAAAAAKPVAKEAAKPVETAAA